MRATCLLFAMPVKPQPSQHTYKPGLAPVPDAKCLGQTSARNAALRIGALSLEQGEGLLWVLSWLCLNKQVKEQASIAQK